MIQVFQIFALRFASIHEVGEFMYSLMVPNWKLNGNYQAGCYQYLSMSSLLFFGLESSKIHILIAYENSSLLRFSQISVV
jgi:hypothetical protein